MNLDTYLSQTNDHSFVLVSILMNRVPPGLMAISMLSAAIWYSHLIWLLFVPLPPVHFELDDSQYYTDDEHHCVHCATTMTTIRDVMSNRNGNWCGFSCVLILVFEFGFLFFMHFRSNYFARVIVAILIISSFRQIFYDTVDFHNQDFDKRRNKHTHTHIIHACTIIARNIPNSTFT